MGRNLGEEGEELITSPTAEKVEKYILSVYQWHQNIIAGTTNLKGPTYEDRIVEQFMVNATYEEDLENSALAEMALIELRKRWVGI